VVRFFFAPPPPLFGNGTGRTHIPSTTGEESSRLKFRTASFCTERSGHYDAFDQGIAFFLPNMTWLQPPGACVRGCRACSTNDVAVPTGGKRDTHARPARAHTHTRTLKRTHTHPLTLTRSLARSLTHSLARSLVPHAHNTYTHARTHRLRAPDDRRVVAGPRPGGLAVAAAGARLQPSVRLLLRQFLQRGV
jgi:hypothetical protein